MPDNSLEELEGRLAAHRELLVTVVCALIENAPLSARDLEQEKLVRNGEEDPGAVPGRAFAIANARTEEMAAVIDRALERVVARERRTD